MFHKTDDWSGWLPVLSKCRYATCVTCSTKHVCVHSDILEIILYTFQFLKLSMYSLLSHICSVLFLCPYFTFLCSISCLLFCLTFLFCTDKTVIALAIKISNVAHLYLACLPDRGSHLLVDLTWTAINNSVRSQVVMSN